MLATCDGKLKIYDTSTGSAPALVRILEGVIGTSDVDSDRSCYVAWHPSGNFFAVPTRTNEIGIFSREGWGKLPAFTQDGHRSVVGELAWSPNGRYLASAAGPQVLVWTTESRQVIARWVSVPDLRRSSRSVVIQTSQAPSRVSASRRPPISSLIPPSGAL